MEPTNRYVYLPVNYPHIPSAGKKLVGKNTRKKSSPTEVTMEKESIERKKISQELIEVNHQHLERQSEEVEQQPDSLPEPATTKSPVLSPAKSPLISLAKSPSRSPARSPIPSIAKSPTRSPVREELRENSSPKIQSPSRMDMDSPLKPTSPKRESEVLSMNIDAKSPVRSDSPKSPQRPRSPPKPAVVMDAEMSPKKTEDPVPTVQEAVVSEAPVKATPMKIGDLLKLAKPTSDKVSVSPQKEISAPVEPLASKKMPDEPEVLTKVASAEAQIHREQPKKDNIESQSSKRESSPQLKSRLISSSPGRDQMNRNSPEPKTLVPNASPEKVISSVSPKREHKISSPARENKSSPRPFPSSPLKSTIKKEEKQEKRKVIDEPAPSKKPKRDHRFVSPQATKPIIQSLDVVKETIKNYVPLRNDPEAPTEASDFEVVELEYPLSNKETFALVTPKREDYDPILDLANTVRYIAFSVIPSHLTDLGNEQTGIVRAITKATNRRMLEELKIAVQDFNQVIKKYQADGVFDNMESTGPRASRELIQHILEQSYARSIAPHSHLLNQYEGFSNNVYGEIKPAFVTEIIKHAEIEPSDIFLDLGSGIGNVVLQVAAECLCESYGIEIMETPASFAKKQRAEFVARMHAYAQPCGRIYLKQGDFLKDEPILQVIGKADVIFVNK
jgi:hypothetical protein